MLEHIPNLTEGFRIGSEYALQRSPCPHSRQFHIIPVSFVIDAVILHLFPSINTHMPSAQALIISQLP
jgi:hypothetical protein